MATYTYRCTVCNEEKDVTHGMTEDPEVTCDACGAKMKKTISGGLTTIFKGSGWAYKDLRKDTK